VEIKVDLSRLPEVTNRIYYPLFSDTSRYQVLVGGAGSGKSYYAAMAKLVRCVQRPKNRTLVVRKVATTLRNSVWRLLKDELTRMGWWKTLVTGHESEMRMRFLNGSEIICVGLDDVEKLKSIQGITDIWIEEATELVMDDFVQLDLRLRGQEQMQIILTFNPISAVHWLRNMFFEQPCVRVGGPGNRYRYYQFATGNIVVQAITLKTTYHDNRFLDPMYKAVIERLKTMNPDLYKVYGLGEWGELKGLIYPDITIVPVEQWPTLEWFDEIIYGLDFGFNNPTALVQVGIKDGAVWERLVLYRSGLTLRQLKELLPEVIGASPYGDPKSVPIYADSSEPGMIQEIYEDGWNIQPAAKGQGSVYAGLMFCKGLRVHVCSDSEDLIKEYRSYMWAQDREGNQLDQPVKFKDHAMDAKRYAEYTHLGMRGEEAFVGVPGLDVHDRGFVGAL